ncbi:MULTISPECIES: late competence development ComFB family protein [Clostridium]|uniref:Late competence development ComFB family protein n=1 Tax=Clostridium aquiflavi TaxID=3073603 RepID=A0ABU1EHI9_9CLOT|nr:MULTISPECIES: late competence development ComFB family protein [unclassified Clostridium]MDR5587842.1 late competence development ComFB family protein [Clostridium sp. 5N-1]NFG61415.1 competence protein [Clostridium botulinum]NFQ10397.1 competence protein [Clostridium botulinum]
MEKAINYMEIWVKECMEKLLIENDMCKCDKCKKDIFALALNNLKPYYVSTNKGEIMAKISGMYQQFETDIVIEVSKAIETVKKYPKHTDETF